jgi:hypothetical protein
MRPCDQPEPLQSWESDGVTQLDREPGAQYRNGALLLRVEISPWDALHHRPQIVQCISKSKRAPDLPQHIRGRVGVPTIGQVSIQLQCADQRHKRCH